MGRRPTTRRKGKHSRLPVEAFLRRKRWSKSTTLLVALLAILLLIVLDHHGTGLYAADDVRRYHGKTFEVVRVIDGDTLVVRARDGEHPTTTVRVWGVDTPELARRDGSKPAEPLAEEAAAYVRSLVEGGAVTLYLEPHRRRGSYGRLLAHVVLEDGSQLGGRLITAGFSVSDGRWSHHQLTAYDLLELKARAQGVGRWSRCDPSERWPIIAIRLAGGADEAYTVGGGVSDGAFALRH
ncbi:MAG: thermonuclease family protein [Planctomycetota bacterium]